MSPGGIDRSAAADREWGAIVVGAGPAGSLVARQLAQRGIDVLLVDRSEFPRDKVCGGCLNARSLALLESAGLSTLLDEEGASPIGRFELVTSGGRAGIALPRGAALSRRRLDHALVRAACDAGARLLTGSRALLGADRIGDRIEVRLPETGETLRAQVVVAADGLSGGFLPEGAVRRRVARGSRLGAWAELPAAELPAAEDGPAAGTIAMAVSSEGYVGSVRVESGAVNLAAALDPRRVREHGLAGAVERVLLQSGAVAPRLEAIRTAAWRGTAPLTRRPASVAAERLFLVGDAGGYVEPFTGEGMAWAFEAALALAPLAERAARCWSPELALEWRRVYARSVGRRQRGCRWVARGLRHPSLVRLAVHALSARPKLAAPLVRRLGGVGARRMNEARPAEVRS